MSAKPANLEGLDDHLVRMGVSQLFLIPDLIWIKHGQSFYSQGRLVAARGV